MMRKMKKPMRGVEAVMANKNISILFPQVVMIFENKVTEGRKTYRSAGGRAGSLSNSDEMTAGYLGAG